MKFTMRTEVQQNVVEPAEPNLGKAITLTVEVPDELIGPDLYGKLNPVWLEKELENALCWHLMKHKVCGGKFFTAIDPWPLPDPRDPH